MQINKEKRNYKHFINLYLKHIQPVADTYAFCLLPNHFHLLAEVKDLTDLGGEANLKGLTPPLRSPFRSLRRGASQIPVRSTMARVSVLDLPGRATERAEGKALWDRKKWENLLEKWRFWIILGVDLWKRSGNKYWPPG